ncbi:MAG: hypothetical protein AAF290_14775 [Pseudomonadota bacterium]
MNYQITVLNHPMAFSLPAGGNLYRQPKPVINELEERGFIYVYRVGYGFNKATGYDAKVRMNLLIKPFATGPIEDTTLVALKRGIQDSGDAMSRRAGKPTVNRMNDYEDFVLGGREWGLLDYPNVALIAIFTRFDQDHFVMLDIEMPKRAKRGGKQWLALKQVLIDTASRVIIDPPVPEGN